MSDTKSIYETASNAIEAQVTTHEQVMLLRQEFVGVGIGIGVAIAVAIGLASPPKPTAIAIATATPIPIPTLLPFVIVCGQRPYQ